MKLLLILISLLSCYVNYGQTRIDSDSLDRWTIIGDFNGDGKSESLIESYISTIDGKEILPTANDVSFDSLIALTIKLKPSVSLKCSDAQIKDLFLVENNQLLGISWLKNIGDIDKNGTDEISLVIDWADWSSANKCTVYTLQNNQWIQFDIFEIREWQMRWTKDETPFEGFVKKEADGIYYVNYFDWIEGDIAQRKLKSIKQ